MAWIKVIDEADVEGDLRDLYDKYTEPWGGVDNILKESFEKPIFI